MFDVVYAKVRGRAVIGSFGEFDIVQAHAEYQLNDIPVGWVTLAVGTDVATGKQVNTSELLEGITGQVPAKIYIELDGKEQLIFDGYTTGTSWVRTTKEMGYSIGLVGWQEDLRASSAMSKTFSVNAPGDLAGSAAAVINTVVSYSPFSAAQQFAVQLSTDVWGGSKAALETICKDKFLTATGSALLGGAGISAEDNSVALGALARFKGDNIAMSTTMSVSIGERLADTLANVVWGGGGGATIWSMMLSLASAYGFAIVPKVESARCVAFTPMLKSKLITKNIGADTYQWVRGGTLSARRLRGVLLVSTGAASATNTDVKVPSQKHAAGRYDSGLEGQWHILSAPIWMDGQIPYAIKTPETTGVGTAAGGVRANGDPGAAGKAGNLSGADTYEELRDDPIGDNYAHDYWLKAVLRGRTASLVGKIRYDICPGTNVSIETAKDITGAGVIYANVTKVGIDVDVGRGQATTTFDIDSMRTANEDKLCVATHPLYNVVFAGDSLV